MPFPFHAAHTDACSLLILHQNSGLCSDQEQVSGRGRQCHSHHLQTGPFEREMRLQLEPRTFCLPSKGSTTGPAGPSLAPACTPRHKVSELRPGIQGILPVMGLCPSPCHQQPRAHQPPKALQHCWGRSETARCNAGPGKHDHCLLLHQEQAKHWGSDVDKGSQWRGCFLGTASKPGLLREHTNRLRALLLEGK